MAENTSDIEAKAAANQETVYQRVNDLIRAAFTKVIGSNMAGGKWLGPSVTLAQPSTAATPAVGVVQPDGTTIEETSGGVISAGSPGGGVGGGGSLQAGANDVTILSGDASGTTTVTFAIPYPTGTTPIVVATNPEVGYQGIIDESLVTNTDFVLGLGVNTGTVGSDTTKNVGWHAALAQLPSGPGGVPVITAPADGAMGVSVTPTVSWTDPAGTLTTEVEASLLSSFATTEWDEYEAGTSLTSPTLPNATLIYLRARVVGPSYSAWGPISSFTTAVASNAALLFTRGTDTLVTLASDIVVSGAWSFGGWFSGMSSFLTEILVNGGYNGVDPTQWNIYATSAGQYLQGYLQSPTADIVIGGAPAINTGNHHFCFVVDGATTYLYLDGSLIASAATPTGPFNATGGVTYFGGYPANPSSLGVAVWGWANYNRALSSGDVSAWVAGGAFAAPPSGAANVWLFSEGSGNSVGDSAGGNNGAIANTAVWTTHS